MGVWKQYDVGVHSHGTVKGWEAVSFNSTFNTVPIVIATGVGLDPKVGVRNITTTGFDLYSEDITDVNWVAHEPGFYNPLDDAFEPITVSENVDVVINPLIVEVLEPFHVLITEHVDIIDLIVEVGVIMEAVTVINQTVEVFVYPLHINVVDEMAVVENTVIVDLILELWTVYDDISIAEETDIQDSIIRLEIVDNISVNDVVDDATTSSGELPYSFQTGAWYDGTYYWRARFDRTLGDIVFEYTTDPDNAWTENTNARISDVGAKHNYSLFYQSSVNKVYFVYQSNAGIEIREAVCTTSFSWSNATTVWANGSKTYENPDIDRDSGEYIWVSCTEFDTGKQYTVAKKATNANDITVWGTASVLGDINNTNVSFATIRCVSTITDKMLCVFVEGTALQSKAFNGTAWDSSPNAIATIKISPQSLVAHQFNMTLIQAINEVRLVYIKSDGTCVERDYSYPNFVAESVLDSNTDCEHPAVGQYYGTSFIAYAWDRPFVSGTNNKLYYILERVSDSSRSEIIEAYTSPNVIIRTTQSPTNTFLTWEESNSIYSKAIGLGIHPSDTVSIVEYSDRDKGLHGFEVYEWTLVNELISVATEALPLDVYENISVTEVVDIFDYVIELGVVADSVSVVENVELYLSTLYSSVFDSVSVTEAVITHDIIIELGIVYDDISITEDIQLLDTGLNFLAYDDITVADVIIFTVPELLIDIFDIVMVSDRSDILDLTVELGILGHVILINENFEIYISNDIFVSDSISITEAVITHDIIIELSAEDTVTVAEDLTPLMAILNVDVNEALSITDVGILNDLIIEVGVLTDDVTVIESVTLVIDALHLSVYDDLAVLEAVVMHDIIIELTASDTATVTEQVTVELPILIINTSEAITATEYATVFDPVIELFVYDTATVTETVITPFGVIIGDDVGVTGALVEYATVLEQIDVVIDVLNLNEVETFTVTEYINIFDRIIELGIVYDEVSISEYASIFDLVVDVSAYDEVMVTEDAVTDFNLDVSAVDTLTISEYISIYFGLEINVTENVTVTDVLYLIGVITTDNFPRIHEVVPRYRIFTVIKNKVEGALL